MQNIQDLKNDQIIWNVDFHEHCGLVRSVPHLKQILTKLENEKYFKITNILK